MRKGAFWILLMLFCLTGSVLAQGAPPPPVGGPNNEPLTIDESYQPVASTYSGIGAITMGEGDSLGDLSLSSQGCANQVSYVAGNPGVVTSDDGTKWIVPMEKAQRICSTTAPGRAIVLSTTFSL
jgi:hypothetical protein